MPWRVTADGNGLVGHAGGILLRKLVGQCGLTAALERVLTVEGTSPSSAGHDPGLDASRRDRAERLHGPPCPGHRPRAHQDRAGQGQDPQAHLGAG